MKSSPLVCICLFILIGVNVISCKKKTNSNPLGGSAIVLINYTNSNGEAAYYRIVYDNNNNVDSIITIGGGVDTGNNRYLKFSYVNSAYNITDNSNTVTKVDINTSLLIDTITSTANNNIVFVKYNGSQIASFNTSMPSSVYPYTSVTSTDYTYANGDIATVTSSGGANTYVYNDGFSGQLGDPQRINEFLSYGRAYSTSAHLPVSLNFGTNWLEQYSYLFDGSGRITQLTKVLNNNSGISYDTLRYNYFYNF